MQFLGWFVLAPWLGASGAAAPVSQQQEVHAIVDARIVVGNGTVLEQGDVLIRHGLIEAVGIDLDGYTRLGVQRPQEQEEVVAPPGNAGEEPDFEADARYATRDANRKGLHAERRARDHLRFEDKSVPALRGAGFTAIHVAPGEGYLAGQTCLVALSGAAPREALIGEPGLLAADLGLRLRGGYPGTLMAVLAHCRQAFHDARRHGLWRERFAASPRGTPRPPSDTCLETLEDALARRMRVAFEADSENDILRALDLAAEFDLQPILVGAREGWRVADRLVREKVPVIAGLDFDDRPERKGARKKKPPQPDDQAGTEAAEGDPAPAEPVAPDAEPDASPEEWDVEDPVLAEPLEIYHARVSRWEEDVDNVRRLLEAGVEVALTTRGSANPADFLADLAVAGERGLAADAMLAAMTTVPARLLGVEPILGTVEAGKAAHLVVASAALGAADREVRFVFVDGRRFEIEARPTPKTGEGDGEASLDLTGSWTVRGTTEDQPFEATLTLTQDEEGALSGSLVSEMGELTIASGSLEGDRFELRLEVQFGNQTFEFTVGGTASRDSLRGTLNSPFGDTPIRATRNPEESRG